jgi:uncharacterized membrane protein YphA (DoxX/SURF4 family)
MKSLPSSSTYAWWLALARIVTGAMWISHALPKFTKSAGFMPPNGFIVTYIANGLSSSTGAYHAFLLNVVQPNIGLFAELVRLGELLTGFALLFGFLTRLGGLTGMVLTLNYLAARGAFASSGVLQTPDFDLCVLSAINLVLPTGRVLGVDALLGRRARYVPETVRAEFVPEPPPSPPPEPSSPMNP